jgi:predicted nucleic acid-binding protein
MTAVLLDSVVLLDVITRDPAWFDWSAAALAEAADGAGAVLNPIVYAEISAAFTDIEAVDAAVPPSIFRREQLPWEAAFLASKAYVAYRRRGGVRRSPLPDFYIGAHAAVAGYRLLTRDARRFRAYFPTIELIAP